MILTHKDVIKGGQDRLINVMAGNCRGHKGKNCCYLRLLSNEDYHRSLESTELGVVLDFNKKNELIGIEFIDGVKIKDSSKKVKIETVLSCDKCGKPLKQVNEYCYGYDCDCHKGLKVSKG